MNLLPTASGIASGAILLGFYIATMTAFNGWQAAAVQFQTIWWLLVPLSAAFGTQVGLFVRLKQSLRAKNASTIATGGASAGVGMLACCVHHATDVLPILGMSALSVFLIRYQQPILLLSLGINLFGIWHLQKILKK